MAEAFGSPSMPCSIFTSLTTDYNLTKFQQFRDIQRMLGWSGRGSKASARHAKILNIKAKRRERERGREREIALN